VWGSPTSIFVLGENFAGKGTYVRDALDLGIRIGMIGGSDSHDGQAGYDTGYLSYAITGYENSAGNARAAEAQFGGLTGLYVRNLSLSGIFEALHARRSMASSVERRIRTDLRINGHYQGEEFFMAPGGNLSISVSVTGQDLLTQVEVIRNGEVWAEQVPGASDTLLVLADVAPATGTNYYYAHVRQLDSAEGFSSPIWVTAGTEPIVTPTPTDVPPQATVTATLALTPTATATEGIGPSATPTEPLHDLNGDGKVDSRDLLLIMQDWHEQAP
jgi:hypothetical protein